MKKIYLLLILCITILWGCKDDNDLRMSPNIRVTANVPNSRTLFTEDDGMTFVSWEVTDVIGIIAPNQNNLEYRVSNAGKTTELKAVAESLYSSEGDSVFAYYPYNHNTDGNKIEIDNTCQYHKENGNSCNFLYANGIVKNGELNLKFNQLLAYLKVTIPTERFPEVWHRRLYVFSEYDTATHQGLSYDICAKYYNPKEGEFYSKGHRIEYVFHPDDLNNKQEVVCYIAILPQEENARIGITMATDKGGLWLFEQATPIGGFKAGNVYELNLKTEAEIEDEKAKERAALIEFYHAANGNEWLNNTNWCSDKAVDEWYGISTDIIEGRVTGINLDMNNVSGEFSHCVKTLLPLSKLSMLHLCGYTCRGDNMSSRIPEEIGLFSNLTSLRLDFNNLSGKLPESLSKLKNLRNLILAYNNLSGDITYLNQVFQKLECLDLRFNQFTGSLPEFNSGIMLQYTVSNNMLTGNIPESHIEALDGNRKNPGGGYNTKYGCWYEIYGNNLTGKVPEKMLNHENWHVHWYNVVRQNEGYGFDEVDLPAPKNTVKCYDGTFLNLDEEYAKNKYTLVFRWNPFSRSIRDCPDPNPDEESINKLFQKYKEQGLGMICSTSAKYSDEEVKTLTSMIPNVKVFWEIQSNYTDDTYENNPYYTYDGGWHYLFKAISSPHFMVVNNDGNIIYSGSEEGCINCYGGVFPQYHKDNNDIFDFVANLFGDDKYIEEKPEIYTSTDYSRDGEIVTLQTASVGKGINLTFMGEAFVDKDMEPNGLYEQKMNEAMEKLFSVEPYSSMRNRFNVYAVKVISPNAEFSEYAEHRINESDSICFEYAQKIPNADKNPPMVSVVYNNWADRSYTTMYSDGSFVGYMMDGISNVLIHESGGHGFANLLDEYVEPGLENSTLSQDEATLLDNLWSTYSWGANVDWRKDKETVKWSHLLKDSRYANEGLGLYEGAYLYGYGAYRPTENSMMRHNNAPFNAPSREQIYKRIMQLSEGEDWKYNYEEFVKFDENNRNSESRSAIKPLTEAERKEYIKNHRPPTFIKGTWRDAMKNGKSRIVVPLR